MPALARILEACDAAKAEVLALLPSPDPTGTVVERVYTFKGPQNDARIRALTGRRVYLFPDSYEQAAIVDRGIDANDYVVTLLVVEVYRGAAPVPPDEWIDERVTFVDGLYRRLQDARAEPIGGQFEAQAGKILSVYDQDVLDEHKTFWSYGQFTLRDYA